MWHIDFVLDIFDAALKFMHFEGQKILDILCLMQKGLAL